MPLRPSAENHLAGIAQMPIDFSWSDEDEDQEMDLYGPEENRDTASGSQHAGLERVLSTHSSGTASLADMDCCLHDLQAWQPENHAYPWFPETVPLDPVALFALDDYAAEGEARILRAYIDMFYPGMADIDAEPAQDLPDPETCVAVDATSAIWNMDQLAASDTWGLSAADEIALSSTGTISWSQMENGDSGFKEDIAAWVQQHPEGRSPLTLAARLAAACIDPVQVLFQADGEADDSGAQVVATGVAYTD